MPGSALSPVATSRLGSQQPLGAGQSRLDGPTAGHGGHSIGKCPARALIRRALGLGHGTLFQNWCPLGLSRQQCLADTPERACFLSTASVLVALEPGGPGRGASEAMLHLSLSLTLFICEMGTTPAPPLKAVHRGKGDNATMKCLKQRLVCSNQVEVEPHYYHCQLCCLLPWWLCIHYKRLHWAMAGSSWSLVSLFIHSGTAGQPHHLFEPWFPHL